MGELALAWGGGVGGTCLTFSDLCLRFNLTQDLSRCVCMVNRSPREPYLFISQTIRALINYYYTRFYSPGADPRGPRSRSRERKSGNNRQRSRSRDSKKRQRSRSRVGRKSNIRRSRSPRSDRKQRRSRSIERDRDRRDRTPDR